MKNDMVNLEINKELIEPIVTKKIEASIAESLISPNIIIEKLVQLALHQKVDNTGKVGQYSSYNSYYFLEIITKNAIQEKAKEALHEWLKENTEKIKQSVINELNKDERRNKIAQVYLDTIEQSLKCNWNMTCNISFDRKYEICKSSCI